MTRDDDTGNTDQPAIAPRLIFDGECGFCRYTVEYAREVSAGRVEYTPYQQVADQFADLSVDDFRRSIVFIDGEGRRSRGAEAAFRALAETPGRGAWLALYRFLPGFAALAEFGYRFVAAHRPAFHRLFRMLYGRAWRPASYTLTRWLFLKLLALIYLAAFASFAFQAKGLIGAEGILPLTEFLDAAAQQLASPLWRVPTLFWLNASDTAIVALCWLGAGTALALLAGLWPRALLAVLFLLYLSLFYAGQSFMSFQWDILLLECGFIAILFAWHAPSGVWLYRWLLFRFMFLSGWVKLASGDPHWADLTALAYHFETQPLPTPLAWYADHLPAGALSFAVGATFLIELVVAFLIFAPRRLRFAAAWAFLGLEFLILLTGNYNFFNLLTMALCLLLFDDRAVARLLPARFGERVERQRDAVAHVRTARTAGLLAAVLAGLGAISLWAVVDRASLPSPMLAVLRAVDPLRAVNGYGLFAVMTTRRDEIVVEGTADGQRWQSYGFRYKPEALDRAPRWIIPHQPRLDWQMWFAALGSPRRNPWFTNFAVRLLLNAEPVLELLEHNPFPDQPPLSIRASLYRYRFTTPAERAQAGHWWARSYVGPYLPPIALQITTPQADAGALMEIPEG